MGKFIRQNINYIKQLCRKAWEASKHFGGAFLNNVFVDYRDGSIWYDTEEHRVCGRAGTDSGRVQEESGRSLPGKKI